MLFQSQRANQVLNGSILMVLLLSALSSLFVPLARGFAPGEIEYGFIPVYGISLFEFHRIHSFTYSAPFLQLLVFLYRLDPGYKIAASTLISIGGIISYSIAFHEAWIWLQAHTIQVELLHWFYLFPAIMGAFVLREWLMSREYLSISRNKRSD